MISRMRRIHAGFLVFDGEGRLFALLGALSSVAVVSVSR